MNVIKAALFEQLVHISIHPLVLFAHYVLEYNVYGYGFRIRR